MIPVPDWSQTAILFPFDLRLTLRPWRMRLLLAGYALAWLSLPMVAWLMGLHGFDHPGMLGVLYALMGTTGPPPLLFSHPPTLAVLYLLGLTLTPAWVVIAGCDQTTHSIRTHFFRFLLLHCSRATLYLSRFMVTVLLVIAMQLLVALCVTATALLLKEAPAGEILLFGLRITLALTLHGVAVTAFMALISAWADTPRTTLFAATLAYGGINQMATVLTPAWDNAPWLLYLIPGGSTPWLMRPEPLYALLGSGVDLLYAVLALWAGWWVFRARAL